MSRKNNSIKTSTRQKLLRKLQEKKNRFVDGDELLFKETKCLVKFGGLFCGGIYIKVSFTPAYLTVYQFGANNN